MNNIQGSRLSETLAPFVNEYICQNCGAFANDNMGHSRWQECDENDQPTPHSICICQQCSEKIIEPHPFLYRRIGYFEPFPGVMQCCSDCLFRKLSRCTHPSLMSNGGDGLEISMPKPDVVFVDTNRGGHQKTMWRGHPTCTERKGEPEEKF